MEIVHGAKIELYPSPTQRHQFDLWRNRARELWNLLLGIEQAAYSGERFKPMLGWRRIWQEVAILNYEIALREWETGKTIRMGKRKGTTIPPRSGEPPAEPSADLLRKMVGGRPGGERPGIFLWEDELMKVMARLKSSDYGKWIGDLHSHACQAVCRDVVKAIKNYLREKKKSEDGSEWGFPRFKKNGYAIGSVYFANTQVKIAWGRNRIMFPHKLGAVKCGPIGKIPDGATLREARIWREGDRWFMSAQFKFKAPEARTKTGKTAGIKVAATAIYTIFDGTKFRQVFSRKYSAREDALFAIRSRQASRKRRRSENWSDAQVRLARQHAYRRNVRADIIHKGSRLIANAFDAVTLDKMDIRKMVRKPSRKNRRHAGTAKKIRKMTLNAAMFDASQKVKYKIEEAGGTFSAEDVFFPSTQICVDCGKVNVVMKRGDRFLRCECGARLQRQKNAAKNLHHKGQRKNTDQSFNVDR